jgi:hypothetical protein
VKVARILNADGPRLHPGAADCAEGDADAVPKYQSDFKIDLDIEWLPSGKLATNVLILACAELACKSCAGSIRMDCSARMPRRVTAPSGGAPVPLH